MYNQINQIFILSILDHLWIEYKKLWSNEYWIIEDWKLTDGYRVNVNWNYVADFSKARSRGSPYAFVKQYLWLDDRGTFNRFKTEFGLENHHKSQYIRKKNLKKKNTLLMEPYSRNNLTTKL